METSESLRSLRAFRQIALKSLSNRKTISNPGLIQRSTKNFHENRTQFKIQESFQIPENLRKSRRIFRLQTIAPVVSTLSRYSTLCRSKLRLVDLESLGERSKLYQVSIKLFSDFGAYFCQT